MRIQYMSDLHLEFQENNRYLRYNELPVTGDVLVLAGDIFYLKDKTAPVMNFWKWAFKNYCQVLIVPGNHVWGIERSGFFNDRGKWAKGFENQRV